tara:strand:+ start:341 stop:640 length:300 start_codon:yes stop_codon:yes gene_type:complete
MIDKPPAKTYNPNLNNSLKFRLLNDNEKEILLFFKLIINRTNNLIKYPITYNKRKVVKSIYLKPCITRIIRLKVFKKNSFKTTGVIASKYDLEREEKIS